MPAVARGGGQDTVSTGHGCDTVTATQQGSLNVFVNGYGACRIGDALQPHTFLVGNQCIPHIAVINTGSSSVFVNGIGISRLGDSADQGFILTGSSNVFAGTKGFILITQDGFTLITEDEYEYEGNS